MTLLRSYTHLTQLITLFKECAVGDCGGVWVPMILDIFPGLVKPNEVEYRSVGGPKARLGRPDLAFF